MQFQFGTPPTPGRYDCVFEVKDRATYDIMGISDSGWCKAQAGGYFFALPRIVQYLGPFPDPLPEPLKPFRRFNVETSDGRRGTGCVIPSCKGATETYGVLWENGHYFRYSQNDVSDLQLDWIDEEPDKNGGDD